MKIKSTEYTYKPTEYLVSSNGSKPRSVTAETFYNLVNALRLRDSNSVSTADDGTTTSVWYV